MIPPAAILALWIVFSVVLAWFAMDYVVRRKRRAHRLAVADLLTSHGTSVAPGETPKQALIRTRAEESMRPLRELGPISTSPPRIPMASRPGFGSDDWDKR